MSNNLFQMHKTLAQSVVSTNFNPKMTTQLAQRARPSQIRPL